MRDGILAGATDGNAPRRPGGRPPRRVLWQACAGYVLTVTRRVCVVGRPFVFRTILKVAGTVLPAAAFTGILITVVFPAATLTAALPETPPERLAVAAI